MDCKYCPETFDSEDDYYSHLASSHTESEVTNLEAKKVKNSYGGFSDEESERDYILMAGLFVAGLFAAGILASVFFMGGDGSTSGEYEHVEHYPSGQAHEHGQWHMEVNGEEIDFSQDKYQVADDKFHFEGGDGERWHAHAQNITIQYALATLGFEVTENHVRFNDTTYERPEEATVTVLVNGEEVDPVTYRLSDGDAVRISIETNQ